MYLPVLINETMRFCIENNFECVGICLNTFLNSSNNLLCSSLCPFECNSVEYEIFSTFSNYQTNFYKTSLNQEGSKLITVMCQKHSQNLITVVCQKHSQKLIYFIIIWKANSLWKQRHTKNPI